MSTLTDHLRALSASAPDEPSPPVEDKAAEAGGEPQLSSDERNAFDEIARALGGWIEETPPVSAPAPVKPQASAGADQSFARNAAALLDRLPIGILVSRGEVPIFANRTLLDLLGHSDIDRFYAHGGLEQMFQGRRAAERGAMDGGAIALATRDGQVISVDGRMQTIDWDGMPASLMSFRRSRQAEFAPRVEAFEAELRARAAELRELHAILDTATDGVAVLDQAGRIVSLNRAAEALFGREQQDAIGLPFTVLLSPDSHAAAHEYLQGLRAGGVAAVMNDGREVIGLERQGGMIPLFLTLGRIGTEEVKFCAVLRDMTQWKKAERDLSEAKKLAEKASAQKSDFLAKISHEIRTPLNAILGFAEVIRDEQFGPIGNGRYKDYVQDIHASGTHVMSLVNDLLDLSKIEAGKLELQFVSVDVNRVMTDCVSLMQPQANQARIVTRVSLAPHLPHVLADERSVKQIVLNLLSNAVKFNEPGGQVIVSTALTDAGHAVIRVRDTGIGMSESEIEMAMEPFRQLETARKVPGTGLGLPLTRALVEANHARFSIRSKKQEGTLIEITFPPVRVLAE
ncbi:PAS domain-containing sensor histidine kinase [Methylovirgula sp. 4M-Z18]|uniref:PAS domain-containing sensor histidine kinase n=1 Tax=Methylovirgula sp. 4M-Z18 TaxID=2293567 RepID=UPI000E2E644A|nr:ATP-binding protein [Methylovirgula sp. 4M-Z18]RFB79696.1 PAS domain S-box protein [Methylovirgula sp. 4M-Z18]